jgi:hypothetical protein
LGKSLEDTALVFLGNSESGIAHGDANLRVSFVASCDGQFQSDTPTRRELDGVIDEIDSYLAKAARVSNNAIRKARGD